MRAIFINAIRQTVEEITLPDQPDSADRATYDAVRVILETTIVESTGLGLGVQLLLDEEGLLRDNPGPFFRIGRPGAWGPIISKSGLLVGTDPLEEEWADFPFSLSQAQKLTSFLPEGTKFVEIEERESVEEHPVLGQVNAIRRVSIFETKDGERIEQ